ncbi:PAS domain S-box protein [Halovenus rubra]|uniref:histidine kinase n=2 Tax=Halovenus rubra TaxID=869890 RepID=A0ABD5X8U3_9EURY|nr:PAS domain-containing sensor histidine kinase [Halovenus rubra]
MSRKDSPELSPQYDTLQVGIALFDPATATVVSANERLVELLGYSNKELRGMPIDRYTANTYRFSEADFVNRLRATDDGTPQQFAWRIKRSDGSLVWVRIHLSCRPDDGEGYVLGEVRDVTEYYTASRREALFWRVLRHNLRNETTKIAGYAQTILSGANRTDIREAAEAVQSTAMELGNVAKSVKEIQQAATESTRQRSYRQTTAAVRDVVADIQTEYPQATITVEEREPMWVHVDTAFDHALSHAVENAVRHSDDQSPRVDIIVGPSPNTGRVEISIADQNDSIPEVETDALDEFAEVSSTSHGTGVGLFVMKWCIESLGGELEFERCDPGNVVRLYLPPKDPPADVT